MMTWNIVKTDNPPIAAKADPMRHGMEVIGKGEYADVWGSEQHPTVFKIGDATDNIGYLNFIKEAHKLGNPYFPKVVQVTIFEPDVSSVWPRSVMLVEIERLKTGNQWAGKSRLRAASFDRACDTVDRLVKTAIWKKRKSATELDLMGAQVSPHLQQAVKTLARIIPKRGYSTGFREKYGSGFMIDMHRGNFMMRGDQLVITDPML